MGTACQEMTLRSALSDPLIRTVMAADNVDPDELESMLRRIAEQIAPNESTPAERHLRRGRQADPVVT